MTKTQKSIATIIGVAYHVHKDRPDAIYAINHITAGIVDALAVTKGFKIIEFYKIITSK